MAGASVAAMGAPLSKAAVRQVVCGLWVWTALLVALLLAHGSAYANGGTTVLRERAGAYEVNIDVPLATAEAGANYHLGVMVLDAETGFVVGDAMVEITALPPPELASTAPVGPVSFLPPNQGGPYSHLDISMPDTGRWTMRIDVAGPLGEASTQFTVKVVKPGIPWGTVAVSAASIFLLFALGWTVFSRGPGRESRQRKNRTG
jgi:hypothetical protein